MKTKFKIGEFVYIKNPLWDLYNRDTKTYKRKIKAIHGDVVFFNDGISEIKYIKKI